MELGIAATSLGGGFFGGIVIGYALIAIVLGLFLAGLAYLQYQGIASLNWNKLHNLKQRVMHHRMAYLGIVEQEHYTLA